MFPNFSASNYKTAYDMLVSPENFALAWQRVRYFDRPDSRDWVGLKTFSANREHSLEILRQSLSERTFEPNYAEIKYMPKASQTLRPMAILAISDRIVFQAIANVIAEMGRILLSMVANRQSFANVLNDVGKPRMFVSWKIQYIQRFQSTFCTLVQDEHNTWIAETDIAAFYETIDHQKLFEILLKDKFADELIIELLKQYLPVWASVENGSKVARGVPQGCLSSDLLANTFLFRFDQELASQEFHYLRYVDDIKILAKEKAAVQRGLIRIDKTLKTMGLLLQTKKTIVREITNFNEEVDRLSVQLSEIDRRLNEPEETFDEVPSDTLTETSLADVAKLGEDVDSKGSNRQSFSGIQDQLQALFWQTNSILNSLNNDPFAERHLRFCLWRLEPDPKIAKAILPYLESRPWLVSDIIAYLKRCQLSQAMNRNLKKIIACHDVYDSTVGSVIDLFTQQDVSLRDECHLFRKWLFESRRDWSLLTAITRALGEKFDNMSVLLKALQSSNSPSVRRMALIQALRITKNIAERVHIFKLAIKDESPVVLDTLLYLLYVESNLTVEQLNIDYEDISDYCKAYAKGYDNTLPNVQQCYIRYVFIRFYQLQFPSTIDLHILLGTDYKRATEHLWQAQCSYLVNPSRYVSKLDLFHEELLYPLLVDKIKWKNNREELAQVPFPSRIDQLQKQTQSLAIFSNALLDCHTLRSSSTEAHTRLHKVLDPTKPISYQDRDRLKQKLVSAYQQLLDWLSNAKP